MNGRMKELALFCTFTLLELLVVIAVISILASLLLPALNLARQSVENATCVNHVRQIGTGWELYTSDNNGFLMPHKTKFASAAGPSTAYIWANVISEYIESRNYGTEAWGGETWSKVGEVFMCPARKRLQRLSPPYNPACAALSGGKSKGIYNWAGRCLDGKRMTSFTQISSTPLVIGGGCYDYGYQPSGLSSYWAPAHPRLNGALLYLDGHARIRDLRWYMNTADSLWATNFPED